MKVPINHMSYGKHLADILASIGDGVIATDLDGKIVYANEAAASIVGCPAEAALGKPFEEVVGLFDAESHERVTSPLVRCIAAGSAVGLENQTVLVTPTGSIKYLSASCAPIVAEGMATGAVIVFRDITSYKILEQKSENDESNLKKIFETAPIGMFILDETGRLVQINHAALSLVDVRKEQVLGKRFGDGFHCKGSLEDKRGCGFGSGCLDCGLRRATLLGLEGLTISGIECQKTLIIGGDEDKRWLRIAAVPLTVGGRPHLVVSVIDITKEKKKEIAATEVCDFYLGIFENLPVLVWQDDIEGKNCFTSSNWQRLTGQSVKEALGDGWRECVHPGDREKLFKKKDGTPSRGESIEAEIRVKGRTGEYRWLQTFSTIYRNIQGEPEGYIGMGIDITDRKEAEEALGRYRLLSEKALDIFLFTDEEGNIIEANDAALTAYGYAREELLTMTVVDLTGEGAKTKKRLSKALSHGIQFESTHYRKDGSSFPAEVKAQGEVISGRKVLLSVIRDVSERKKAEEALRQSEEKFRVFFNKAIDAIYIVEETNNPEAPWIFTDVNDVACSQLGYTREELIGKGLDFIDKAVTPLQVTSSRQSLQTTGKMVLETTHTAKSGQEIAVEIVGHDLELNGRRVYMMAARDITERKRAAEELAASRAEYHSLFLHIPTAFAYGRVIFDEQQTIPDFEYIEVNEAFEKIIGVPREKIIGNRFLQVFPTLPKENLDLLDFYGEVASGQKDQVEVEYYSPIAGRWLAMTLYSPARGYAVSLFTDITERRQAQEAFEKAKNEAEAAYRAKSEFLANMSHEIRTPINGINGMIDLTLLTALSPDQKDNLLTAKSCTHALLGIISDILDFSKMEAGKLAVETIDFRCRDVIDEVVKVHSQAALAKGLDLDYSMSANIPAVLAGDPNRLRQVLNNLLSNAIKFTESGQVTLAVKRTATEGNRSELTFSVTDTGIGIAEEEMKRLFKPFSQVDSSVTRRFGGTGLGLVISKQLVELMGGSISAKSEKGKGSTFVFSVSLAPALGTGELGYAAKPVAEIHQSLRPLSLLLAEDDIVSSRVIQQYLRELSHEVDSAVDGQQALDLFIQKPYDAVLMDIQMPVMDGVETTRRIREIEAGRDRHTPIIAITAHALYGDREKYLAAGLDEYIAKPVQIGELQAKLEQVTSIDALRSYKVSATHANITAAFDQDERAKTLDEIDSLNQMIELYKADLMLYEGLVHQIKVLANQAGLEELKTLAFKAELAARRANVEEAFGYTSRIREVIEIYRRTYCLS